MNFFRWLATKFLSQEAQYRAGVNIDALAENSEGVRRKGTGLNQAEGLRAKVAFTPNVSAAAPVAPKVGTSEGGKGSPFAAIQNQEDAPPCTTCGSIMIRSGSCYKYSNCGTTSGCASSNEM